MTFKKIESEKTKDLKPFPNKKEEILRKNSIDLNHKQNDLEEMVFIEEMLRKRNFQTIEEVNSLLFFVNFLFFVNLNCKLKEDRIDFTCNCKKTLNNENGRCAFHAYYDLSEKKLHVLSKHSFDRKYEFKNTQNKRYNGELEEVIKNYLNNQNI